MAHKKGQGSSRNGRDSNAQRRGTKCFGGQQSGREHPGTSSGHQVPPRQGGRPGQRLHALRRHRRLCEVRPRRPPRPRRRVADELVTAARGFAAANHKRRSGHCTPSSGGPCRDGARPLNCPPPTPHRAGNGVLPRQPGRSAAGSPETAARRPCRPRTPPGRTTRAAGQGPTYQSRPPSPGPCSTIPKRGYSCSRSGGWPPNGSPPRTESPGSPSSGRAGHCRLRHTQQFEAPVVEADHARPRPAG